MRTVVTPALVAAMIAGYREGATLQELSDAMHIKPSRIGLLIKEAVGDAEYLKLVNMRREAAGRVAREKASEEVRNTTVHWAFMKPWGPRVST